VPVQATNPRNHGDGAGDSSLRRGSPISASTWCASSATTGRARRDPNDRLAHLIEDWGIAELRYVLCGRLMRELGRAGEDMRHSAGNEDHPGDRVAREYASRHPQIVDLLGGIAPGSGSDIGQPSGSRAHGSSGGGTWRAGADEARRNIGSGSAFISEPLRHKRLGLHLTANRKCGMLL
jgi:hypothetical protein